MPIISILTMKVNELNLKIKKIFLSTNLIFIIKEIISYKFDNFLFLICSIEK